MKKFLVVFGFMLLLTMPLFAQRAAVMEFKAGVGISQADVDGLSGIFTTYFRPAGFTMVERTQIDRVISEQGFQRSCLTEAQMVRIGKILNLSLIVIGDINVVRGEYNVDVRVVNVESGVILATDGETFGGNSYRNSMKKLAQKLAGQVAIRPGQTVQSAPKPEPQPEPKKLQWSEKSSKAMKWDEAMFYCENLSEGNFSDWRMPTISELRTLVKNCPPTQVGGSCPISDIRTNYNEPCDGSKLPCYCSSSSMGIYSIFGDKEPLWSSVTAKYRECISVAYATYRLRDSTNDESYALEIDFSDGAIDGRDKGYRAYVRCVR